MRTHTGGLAERFIFGRFANVGVGSFPFDTAIHVRECPDKRLLEEVRYGVDWGWTNPSAIICIGYDHDDRVYVLDEFYKPIVSKEDLLKKLNDFQTTYGTGEVFCDGREPEAIAKFNAGIPERKLLLVRALAYSHKREDEIRELDARFPKAGDSLPRMFIARRCVNLISELLEYQIEVKEKDHAVDALKYALKLQNYPPLNAFRFG